MKANTPLLRSIQRLVRESAAARAHGVPREALPDLRAERRERAASLRVHRRALLAGAAAGAVSAALPRRASGRDQPRIAIVGAGIAGLACALDLADHGLRATVYEASDRVGGRMFSGAGYFDEGQVSEWCGELIDTDNVALHTLAARFGLTMEEVDAGEPEEAGPIFHFDGAFYPATQADADFAAVHDAVAIDFAAASSTLAGAPTPAGRALDAISVHAWIEARIPGGHRAPLGQLLDVAYVIQHGADTRDQSALALLHFLGRRPAPDTPPSRLMLFGASDERYHVRGGNQRIPEAIARSLGEAVALDHRLLRICRTPAGGSRLTFARGRGTVEVGADLVVLAIPFAVLAGVDWSGAGFDGRKARAILELGRAHNGKTQVQLTERVWARRGPWPGIGSGSSYADTGYQNTWEASRPPGARGALLVFYTGGPVADALRATAPFATAAAPGVIADARALLDRAEPVFPGLGARWNGRATQSLPHLSELHRASYAYRRVGQYAAFAGHEGARQGGVLFCGEHTSLTHPAHMEGAAREGMRAAREIRELLARRAP